MTNKLEWIFMIVGMVGAIGSMIVAIALDQSYTWQAITAIWIGVCMIKQGTIQKLTK